MSPAISHDSSKATKSWYGGARYASVPPALVAVGKVADRLKEDGHAEQLDANRAEQERPHRENEQASNRSISSQPHQQEDGGQHQYGEAVGDDSRDRQLLLVDVENGPGRPLQSLVQDGEFVEAEKTEHGR
jgi:hypothetical protein